MAAANPAKLKEPQDIFMREATPIPWRPIDDRLLERIVASSAGRPDLMGERTSLTLPEGMDSMSENVFLNLKNRSHSITADLEIPAGGANGVVIARAGCRRLEPVSQGRQADLLL